MTSVGFLELHTHEHILYMWAHIANTGDDVDVFTTESIADQVTEKLGQEASDIDWHCKSDGESVASFLNGIEKEQTKDLDVLITLSMFGGCRRMVRYARFQPKCKHLLWIYNVNLWLDNSPSLSNGFRDNLKTVLRQRILHNVDAINVEYPPIKRYIDKNFEVQTPIYTLIPALFEGEQCIPDKPIRITVPGYIESERRNYDIVLDVFDHLLEQSGDDLELYLLGTSKGEYGDYILNRCERLQSKGYNITTFDEWIPLETFERIVRESHFLLSPLQRRIEKPPTEEQYGTTKGSGNVFDGLRTATPLILPNYFEIDDIISDSVITYEGKNDLQKSIESMIENPRRVTSFQRAARQNSEKFRRDAQYTRFLRVMDDLLSQ